MPTINEVASELGLTDYDARARLERLGHPVANGSSSIDETSAERLRSDVRSPGVTTAVQSSSPGLNEPSGNGYSDRRPAPRDVARSGSGRGSSGTAASRKKRSVAGQIAELPILILLAFIIAVIIKTFLVQAFYIPSESMLPTLHKGDRVLVEKVGYLVDSPSRKDVVVFARSVLPGQPDLPWHEDARNFVRELLGLPTALQEDYIKRIAAVGGDVISYSDTPRVLKINGEPVDEPYIKGGEDSSSTTILNRDCKRMQLETAPGGCRVPEGKIFVMGDNRSNSQDSRFIGPIDEDDVVGRAFVILWPPADFAGL